jgi:hypothetical protein
VLLAKPSPKNVNVLHGFVVPCSTLRSS